MSDLERAPQEKIHPDGGSDGMAEFDLLGLNTPSASKRN